MHNRPKPTINVIAAVQTDGGIGKDNKLLYRIKEDMRFFRGQTFSHVVIMGRNTYESMGSKPLDNRVNMVLSKSHETGTDNDGVMWFHSLDEALKESEYFTSDGMEVYVIGGASVYKEALERGLVDYIYLTEIDSHREADTFFPLTLQELSKYDNSQLLEYKTDNGVGLRMKRYAVKFNFENWEKYLG